MMLDTRARYLNLPDPGSDEDGDSDEDEVDEDDDAGDNSDGDDDVDILPATERVRVPTVNVERNRVIRNFF